MMCIIIICGINVYDRAQDGHESEGRCLFCITLDVDDTFSFHSMKTSIIGSFIRFRLRTLSTYCGRFRQILPEILIQCTSIDNISV